MPYGCQIFKLEALTEIKKIVKENKKINFDALCIKLQANPPYLSEKMAKKYLSILIQDKQIAVDSNGETYLCHGKE